jgi:Uncharacterized protein conserved in bacteria
MTGIDGHQRNLLEPAAFVALFRDHPPAGFTCASASSGLPLFCTDFDLLTTLDSVVRARLEKIPLASALAKRLTFATCFTGTTITEYTPLPGDIAPVDLVDDLLYQQGGKQSLTIIKDLPNASPLLSEDDNAHAEEVARVAQKRGFIAVEGQALAYLPLDFGNLEGYFARLSAGRRKDLRRKMKTRSSIEVDVMSLGDSRFKDAAFLQELYTLYLEVYEQSQIHFDLLSPSFFATLLGSENIRGIVVCYRHRDVLAGYNICLIHNDLFIDKYIGFCYPLARKLNLYFVSWLVNLEIALQHGCSAYVAGWTDVKVKAALGMQFTFTRHLVWVRNPILRRILSPLHHFFESDGRALDGTP